MQMDCSSWFSKERYQRIEFSDSCMDQELSIPSGSHNSIADLPNPQARARGMLSGSCL